MKKENTSSLSRYLLYTGIIIQLAYIISTPFIDISIFILLSTAILLTTGFLDLSIAKNELNGSITAEELSWSEKRKNLQNFYKDEKNLDKTFSECLSKIQLADTHSERISKILDNYQTNNKKFKIKLNRHPENRLDQYLQE